MIGGARLYAVRVLAISGACVWLARRVAPQ